VKLPLTYIPSSTPGQFFHSDAAGVAKLLSLFDFSAERHERTQRIAALRLRKLMLDAHEAQLDMVELADDELDVLRRVLADPKAHLQEAAIIDGRAIPVREGVLRELFVVAAMENLRLVLDEKPGLYAGLPERPEPSS